MTNLKSKRSKEAIVRDLTLGLETCIWTEHCSNWEIMIPEFVKKSLVYDEK